MKSKKLLQGLIVILVIAAMFLSSLPAKAQTTFRVKIEDISNAGFPMIEAYVSVSDMQGLPVSNLSADLFLISEDGKPIKNNPGANLMIAPAMNTKKPLAVALVVDTSSTMGFEPKPTRLETTVQAARSFLASLVPKDSVAVIGFSETAYLVQDLTTDKTLISSALGKLKSGGDTAMEDAIVQAVNVLKNRSERQVIVLITDGGGPGVGRFTLDQAINEAQKSKIPVYTIGIEGANKNDLQRLATLTGGAAQVKPKASDLQAALDYLLEILRGQYKISYTSALPQDNDPTKDHTLEVAVDYQRWHASGEGKFKALPSTAVWIKKPAEGDTVGNSAMIVADVYSFSGVDRVEFKAGDQLISTVTTSPYQVKWDVPSQDPGGPRVIRVTAYSKDSSTGQAKVTVNVVLSTLGTTAANNSWLVIVGVLVVAGVLIPLALRNKRRMSSPRTSAPRKEQAKIGQAKLREMEGLNPNQIWPLTNEVRLGRKTDENDIPLQGVSASRRHALIRFEQGRYVIHNLSSNNPTIVNNAPVPQQRALQPGDVIRLGETVLRYE